MDQIFWKFVAREHIFPPKVATERGLPRVSASLVGFSRMHFIFLLRLFNDYFAMTLLNAAVASFIYQKGILGCLFSEKLVLTFEMFYDSVVVSIKMTVLLYPPPLPTHAEGSLGVTLSACASYFIYKSFQSWPCLRPFLDGEDPKQSTVDMTAFVQNLLQQMQGRFQTMSESIITKIDEMGSKINELEQSINDLRAEMGTEGSPSPLAPSKKSDEMKLKDGSS